MQKKRRKLIAAIGIVSFLAVGLIVGIYFNFGMIGPGLPPSINGWYFPSPDGKTFNGTRFFSNTGSEHFGMIGEVSASCPSLFPSISSDCLYGEFERYYANSSPMPERYIVISWYFNSDKI